MKGRIAPALVTPATGESILKPRFRRDRCPLRTCLQPRAAAAFPGYSLQCISMGELPSKLPLLLGGILAQPNT